MPDYAPAAEGLWNAFGSLIKYALRGLLASVIGTMVYSTALIGVAVAIAAEGDERGSFVRRLCAFLFAGLVSAFMGAIVAVKQAVGRALIQGLRQWSLGAKVVGWTFDEILSIEDERPMGERGIAVARFAERMPLAKAQARLDAAVASLTQAAERERGARAWFGRRFRERLLREVRSLTLARFRQEDGHAGGVDLCAVRNALSVEADALLMKTIEAGLLKVTVAVALGTTVLVVLVAFFIRMVPIG